MSQVHSGCICLETSQRLGRLESVEYSKGRLWDATLGAVLVRKGMEGFRGSAEAHEKGHETYEKFECMRQFNVVQCRVHLEPKLDQGDIPRLHFISYGRDFYNCKPWSRVTEHTYSVIILDIWERVWYVGPCEESLKGKPTFNFILQAAYISV